MRASSRIDIALALAFTVLAALFLLRLMDVDVLGAKGRVLAGAATKLASFVTGAVFAARTARSFTAGPMRAGWTLVAVWMGTWFLAQAWLSGHQIVTGASPFPSPADAFFVIGYFAMLVAFAVFIHAWAATGLVGAPAGHVALAVGVAVPFVALGVVVLRPVVAAGGAPLELALNVGYPALDILALVPTVLLARVALRMMGGALLWVWALMALGIVCMVAGDLLYGWFSALEYSGLDPLLDVAYIAGYGLVARAIYQQHRISVVR